MRTLPVEGEIMKLFGSIIMAIGFVVPVVAGSFEIDFDGRSHENLNFVEAVRESQDNLQGSQPSHDKRVMMELTLHDDSGIVRVVSIGKDDPPETLRIEPNEEFSITYWCENSDSPWSFTQSYKMTTLKEQDHVIPGHYHPTVSEPNLPAPTPIIYQNKKPLPNPLTVNYVPTTAKYVLDLVAPLFATKIIFSMHSNPCGNSGATAIIDVQNNTTLMALKEGDFTKGYYLQRHANDVKYHKSCFNVTSGFQRVLEHLGAYWRKNCPESESLYYQRMSLPWGGVFDRDLNWVEPYSRHDKGLSVDISKLRVLDGNRQGLINAMCNLGLEVYSEKDPDGNSHYHVTQHVDKENNTPKDALACCLKYGAVEYPKGCINADQSAAFPNTSESDCEDLPSEQYPNLVQMYNWGGL